MIKHRNAPDAPLDPADGPIRFAVPLRAVCFAPALIVLAALLTLFWKQMEDDVFIYMRYARNLTAFGEVSFNRGEPLIGFTGLLQFWFVAALNLLPVDLEGAVFVAGALLHAMAVGALALFFVQAAGGSVKSAWAALMFPLWFGFDRLAISTIGMESGWMALLSIVVLAEYFHRSKSRAIALSSILILVRPDAALLPPILIIHFIAVERKVPWRALGCVATCAAIWLGFNVAATGEALPSTLAAKRAQMAAGVVDRTFGGKLITGGFPRHEKHVVYYILLALFGARFCFAVWKDAAFRKYALIPAWGVCYAAAYAALGVPYYYIWYYVPLIVAANLMAGLGAVSLIVGLGGQERGAAWRLPVWALLAAAALYPWFMLWQDVSDPHMRTRREMTENYKRAAEFIHRNSTPSQSVALVEIGVVGFELDNPVIDLLGIVTPQSLPHIRERNWDYAYLELKPDFVVVHDPPFVPEMPVVSGAFKENYRMGWKIRDTSNGINATVAVMERRHSAGVE